MEQTFEFYRNIRNELQENNFDQNEIGCNWHIRIEKKYTKKVHKQNLMHSIFCLSNYFQFHIIFENILEQIDLHFVIVMLFTDRIIYSKNIWMHMAHHFQVFSFQNSIAFLFSSKLTLIWNIKFGRKVSILWIWMYQINFRAELWSIF